MSVGGTDLGGMEEEVVDAELEELLRFIRDARGFDFTGYKRSSVGRRVCRRMQEVACESIREYRDLLEADIDEFTALFNTILINLTGFFRDPAAWRYLESHVLPEIVARRGDDQPIRMWSAGCASGEEPYTLAMAMANILGIAETARRVKIYATDIDLDALGQARAAVYSDKVLADVPPACRDLYFQPDVRGYLNPDTQNRGSVIIPSLRRTVVFGRLDLTKDPPISRVDLVACRNTLMYLTAETQAYVIPRLQYALREGGYLFLGRAEMVLRGGAGRFTPISLRHRIFVAMPHLVPANPLLDAYTERHPFDLGPPEHVPPGALEIASSSEQAYEVVTIAELVVDVDGNLVSANDAAQRLLGLQGGDAGKALAEFPFASEPLALGPAVAEAIADATAHELGVAHVTVADGSVLDLDVRVLPNLDARNHVLGAIVSFDDVRSAQVLREGYRQMHEELETAYEELQSTNEELVTSNEELQSSYEELETSNEELQSANEELETTNEELRSSNEELEATNMDLKATSEAVEQLNATLVEANRELLSYSGRHRNVIDNFPAAVVVLNTSLLIEEWNARASALWGLREEEVLGEPFFGLDFGLPLGALQDPVRACRSPGATPTTVVLDAVDHEGRPLRCTVRVLPIGSPELAAMLVIEVAETAGS